MSEEENGVEPVSRDDLDNWISRLLKCKLLTEDEVLKLTFFAKENLQQ